MTRSLKKTKPLLSQFSCRSTSPLIEIFELYGAKNKYMGIALLLVYRYKVLESTSCIQCHDRRGGSQDMKESSQGMRGLEAIGIESHDRKLVDGFGNLAVLRRFAPYWWPEWEADTATVFARNRSGVNKDKSSNGLVIFPNAFLLANILSIRKNGTKKKNVRCKSIKVGDTLVEETIWAHVMACRPSKNIGSFPKPYG